MGECYVYILHNLGPTNTISKFCIPIAKFPLGRKDPRTLQIFFSSFAMLCMKFKASNSCYEKDRVII